MVVSYHPCIPGDRNRICAGRAPDAADREALSRADAVILPQGCPSGLFEMARRLCPHVFPDYTARFRFPGKTGQVRLFRAHGLALPPSEIYESAEDFRTRAGGSGLSPPLVLKLDWGGEGETVFFGESAADLQDRAILAGTAGLVLQQYIPNDNRCLRVVVVGERLISYWRVQPRSREFRANLAAGAFLDPASDPGLQEIGREAVRHAGRSTGINLAGFDLIFPEGAFPPRPLFLEINYFFGREGLGGSDAYYRILQAEVTRWLEGVGLRMPEVRT